MKKNEAIAADSDAIRLSDSDSTARLMQSLIGVKLPAHAVESEAEMDKGTDE